MAATLSPEGSAGNLQMFEEGIGAKDLKDKKKAKDLLEILNESLQE